MVSTFQLVKIAGYGGCVVAVTGYFVQYTYRNRLRQTNIYKETMQTMRSHEKVVNHLGEPIREGRTSVGEYNENMRWLSVQVFGSKTNGKVRCDFVPNIEGVRPSQVYKIEMEFADRKGLSYLLREDIIENNV